MSKRTLRSTHCILINPDASAEALRELAIEQLGQIEKTLESFVVGCRIEDIEKADMLNLHYLTQQMLSNSLDLLNAAGGRT